MTQWHNISRKAITSPLNHSNLYGYSICHGNNISQQPSGYSICHNHIISAVTHVVPSSTWSKHQPKTMAITSAMVAITSATYICDLPSVTINWWLLSYNNVVSISHCIQCDNNICHKGIIAITSLAIASAKNI